MILPGDPRFVSASQSNATALDLASNGLELKVQDIDAAIIEAAQVPAFTASVSVPQFIPGQIITEEVYQLVRIYSDRGFITQYDGNAGTLTLSWANPKMTFQDINSVNYPVFSKISLLGYDFQAFVLYLYMTGGLDLRVTTNNAAARYVNDQIQRAAAQGQNTLRLPVFDNKPIVKVSAAVLNVLYADLLQMLMVAGYTASFADGQGLNISWANASTLSPAVSTGETLAVAQF